MRAVNVHSGSTRICRDVDGGHAGKRFNDLRDSGDSVLRVQCGECFVWLRHGGILAPNRALAVAAFNERHVGGSV